MWKWGTALAAVAAMVGIGAGTAADARVVQGNGSASRPFAFSGDELGFSGVKVGQYVTGPCSSHFSMSREPPLQNGDTTTLVDTAVIVQNVHGWYQWIQDPECRPVRLGAPGHYTLTISRRIVVSRIELGMGFVERDDTREIRIPIWVKGGPLRPSRGPCQVTVVASSGRLQTYLPDRGLSGAEPAGQGRVIKAGRALQTGHESSATVMFPDGGYLELRANSGFVLDQRLCDTPPARHLAKRRVKVTGDGTLDTEGAVRPEVEFRTGGKSTTWAARGTRVQWRTAPDGASMVVRVAEGAIAHPRTGRARVVLRAGNCVDLARGRIARRPYRCDQLFPASLDELPD